ncbi:hypothetical protein EDD22DRAFT_950110 [Suillus occidentalis]|nr:hypothetical protein EDD22DRAFT_950110 [Suillus occidentalis]
MSDSAHSKSTFRSSSPLTNIDSVSSHVSDDSLTAQEPEDGYHKSALWRLLYRTRKLPGDNLLSGLPDPLGCYSGLITQYHLQDAIIMPPTVCVGNGVLIKPAEYGTKLTNGDPVMVECQLKLWNIGPNKRENTPAEEKNRLRCYQVMLKSLKLLPDASITAKTLHDFHLSTKGKCKASDLDDCSCTQKKVHCDEDFEDEDPWDDVVSSSNRLNAMQTED